MKPKQIVPTNGNPTQAVAPMPPEAISSGTVPLLEHLQTIKEKATGMSKAAQGLNDELYVSGNSETKLQAVQNASQKRIQHIARRFAETGIKKLCKGLYTEMRRNMNQKIKLRMHGVFAEIVPSDLPKEMDVEIFLDLGENSNANLLQKYARLGTEVFPALQASGHGSIIKPEAPAVLATRIVESLGLDSNDFLVDYTTEEFLQQAVQQLQMQQQEQAELKELEKRKMNADVSLAEANVAFTGAQTKNTADDNAKQLAVSIDKHFQEWEDLRIKAGKEEIEGAPERPNYTQILMMAKQLLNGGNQ